MKIGSDIAINKIEQILLEIRSVLHRLCDIFFFLYIFLYLHKVLYIYTIVIITSIHGLFFAL